MRKGIAAPTYVLGLAILLCSCASFGTKVDIRSPDLVNTIRVVGIAPIYVDGLTLSVCAPAESVAMAALVSQIEQSGAFKVVSADTLVAQAQEEDNQTEQQDCGYMNAEALLTCARRLNLDGVLYCKLEAYEVGSTTTETVGWGVSFGTSGTSAYLVEEPVTKINWAGAIVSLQIAECSAGQLVMATKFDTMKGKSYSFAPPPEKQIVDAVMGAFKPVAKEWAKQVGGTK